MKEGSYDYNKNNLSSKKNKSTNKTFSVSIFKWVTRSNGKGIKKSKAICRVMGYTKNHDAVIEKADAIIFFLNTGQEEESDLKKLYFVKE